MPLRIHELSSNKKKLAHKYQGKKTQVRPGIRIFENLIILGFGPGHNLSLLGQEIPGLDPGRPRFWVWNLDEHPYYEEFTLHHLILSCLSLVLL